MRRPPAAAKAGLDVELLPQRWSAAPPPGKGALCSRYGLPLLRTNAHEWGTPFSGVKNRAGEVSHRLLPGLVPSQDLLQGAVRGLPSFARVHPSALLRVGSRGRPPLREFWRRAVRAND